MGPRKSYRKLVCSHPNAAAQPLSQTHRHMFNYLEQLKKKERRILLKALLCFFLEREKFPRVPCFQFVPLPVPGGRCRRACAPGDGEGFIWVKKKKKKVIKTGVHFPGGGWAPGEGDGSESQAEHIRSCFLLWLLS